MRPRALSALLLATAVLVPTWARGDAALSAPPIELPQVRIDRIDSSAFPHVRVLASFLDKRGRPVPLKVVKKLSVVDAKRKARPPYAAFALGQPLGGRKDCKLQGLDKTGIANAVVFVVAGYQDDALRRGSLGRRVKDAVAAAFKPLAKTDRANILWYGDRIYRHVGLKGRGGELSDIEDARKLCADARAEALAGGAVTGAGPGDKDHPAPPPGTDLCGLASDFKPMLDVVKGQQTAYEGYFPRLFGLGLPFWEHTRYCAPPPEALKGFGEFEGGNATRRASERDEQKAKGQALDFETDAFDEALRLLLQEGRPEERKSIVLISDGRDGYLRDLDLCRATPPEPCRSAPEAKRKACIDEFLRQRLITQQQQFRQRAEHWIGTARAADIRVFAVGLGTLGAPYELERLRVLAERSGGTYRQVDKEENLVGAVAATVGELTGALAIDFTHQEPEEAGAQLDLQLEVEMDASVGGGETRFRSTLVSAPIPVQPSWLERTERSVRAAVVAVQEAIGYRTFVLGVTAAAVLGGLLFLLLLFLVLRAVVRKARS